MDFTASQSKTKISISHFSIPHPDQEREMDAYHFTPQKSASRLFLIGDAIGKDIKNFYQYFLNYPEVGSTKSHFTDPRWPGYPTDVNKIWNHPDVEEKKIDELSYLQYVTLVTIHTASPIEFPIENIFSDLWLKYESKQQYVELIESKIFIIHALHQIFELERAYDVMEEVLTLFSNHIAPKLAVTFTDGSTGTATPADDPEVQKLLQLQFHVGLLAILIYNQFLEWDKAYLYNSMVMNALWKQKKEFYFPYFLKMSIKHLFFMEKYQEAENQTRALFARLTEAEAIAAANAKKPFDERLKESIALADTATNALDWYIYLGGYSTSKWKPALITYCKHIIEFFDIRNGTSVYPTTTGNTANNVNQMEDSTTDDQTIWMRELGPYTSIYEPPIACNGDNTQITKWLLIMSKFWRFIIENPFYSKKLLTTLKENPNEFKLNDIDTNYVNKLWNDCKTLIESIAQTANTGFIHSLIGRLITPSYGDAADVSNHGPVLIWYLSKSHDIIVKRRIQRNENHLTSRIRHNNDLLFTFQQRPSWRQSIFIAYCDELMKKTYKDRDSRKSLIYPILQEIVQYVNEDDAIIATTTTTTTTGPNYANILTTLFIAYHELIRVSTSDRLIRRYWEELISLLERQFHITKKDNTIVKVPLEAINMFIQLFHELKFPLTIELRNRYYNLFRKLAEWINDKQPSDLLEQVERYHQGKTISNGGSRRDETTAKPLIWKLKIWLESITLCYDNFNMKMYNNIYNDLHIIMNDFFINRFTTSTTTTTTISMKDDFTTYWQNKFQYFHETMTWITTKVLIDPLYTTERGDYRLPTPIVLLSLEICYLVYNLIQQLFPYYYTFSMLTNHQQLIIKELNNMINIIMEKVLTKAIPALTSGRTDILLFGKRFFHSQQGIFLQYLMNNFHKQHSMYGLTDDTMNVIPYNEILNDMLCSDEVYIKRVLQLQVSYHNHNRYYGFSEVPKLPTGYVPNGDNAEKVMRWTPSYIPQHTIEIKRYLPYLYDQSDTVTPLKDTHTENYHSMMAFNIVLRSEGLISISNRSSPGISRLDKHCIILSCDLFELIEGIITSSTRYTLQELEFIGSYDSYIFMNNFVYGFLAWKIIPRSFPSVITSSSCVGLRVLTLSYCDTCDYTVFFNVLKYNHTIERLSFTTTQSNNNPTIYMKSNFLLQLAECIEYMNNTNETCILQSLSLDFLLNRYDNIDNLYSVIYFMISDKSGKYNDWRYDRKVMKELLTSNCAQPILKSLKSLSFSMDYIGRLSTQSLRDEELDMLLLAYQINPILMTSLKPLFEHNYAINRVDSILTVLTTLGTTAAAAAGSSMNTSSCCLEEIVFSNDVLYSITKTTMLTTKFITPLVSLCQCNFSTLKTITFHNCGISSYALESFFTTLVDSETILPNLRKLTLIGIKMNDAIASTLGELITAGSFPQLEELVIQSCNLTSTQSDSIIASIMHMEIPLRNLDFTDNCLSTECIGILIAWIISNTACKYLERICLQSNGMLTESDEVMIIQAFARCYHHRLPIGPLFFRGFDGKKKIPISLGMFCDYLSGHYWQIRSRLEIDMLASQGLTTSTATIDQLVEVKQRVEQMLSLTSIDCGSSSASDTGIGSTSATITTSSSQQNSGFTTFLGYLLAWWKQLIPYLHPQELTVFITIDASFLSYGSIHEIIDYLTICINLVNKYYRDIWQNKFSMNIGLSFDIDMLTTDKRDLGVTLNRHYSILLEKFLIIDNISRNILEFLLHNNIVFKCDSIITKLINMIIDESKTLLSKMVSSFNNNSKLTTKRIANNGTSTSSKGKAKATSTSNTSNNGINSNEENKIDTIDAFKLVVNSLLLKDDKNRLLNTLQKLHTRWKQLYRNIPTNNVLDGMDIMTQNIAMTRLRNLIIWICKQSIICLVEVGLHLDDYHDIFPQIVDELLTEWYRRESDFQLQYGNQQRRSSTTTSTIRQEVFDLNEIESLQAYIVLRYKIRKGGINNNVLITDASRLQERDLYVFLLSIPSVRRIVHQDFQQYRLSGGENALLRIAMEVNNSLAAELLLSIEAVRRHAERNNYYVTSNSRNSMDLRRLANDRESSMMSLTAGEESRLRRLKAHYSPKITAMGGVNKVFDLLLQRLEIEYSKKPLILSFNKPSQPVVTLSLPLKWSDLRQMLLMYSLIDHEDNQNDGNQLIQIVESEAVVLRNNTNASESDLQKIFEAYHSNSIHSAWRYLQKPNQWMSLRAQYVEVHNQHWRYSTFEDYKPLIVLLFLAAIDPEQIGHDRYTIDARFEHFMNELALINRAHNWDHTRQSSSRMQNQEEYDLLYEGDRPSCCSGVKRRLFQSLIDHPLFVVLTIDIVYQELKEYFQQLFLDKIRQCVANRAVSSSGSTGSDSLSIKNAIGRYQQAYEEWVIELNEEAISVLKEVNIVESMDEKVVENLRMVFDAMMTEKYGDSYSEDVSIGMRVGGKFSLLRTIKPTQGEKEQKPVSQLVQLAGLVDVNLIFKRAMEFHGCV